MYVLASAAVHFDRESSPCQRPIVDSYSRLGFCLASVFWNRVSFLRFFMRAQLIVHFCQRFLALSSLYFMCMWSLLNQWPRFVFVPDAAFYSVISAWNRNAALLSLDLPKPTKGRTATLLLTYSPFAILQFDPSSPEFNLLWRNCFQQAGVGAQKTELCHSCRPVERRNGGFWWKQRSMWAMSWCCTPKLIPTRHFRTLK